MLPRPPVPIVRPAGNALLLRHARPVSPISDLAESVVRGASVRINPRSNGHYLFA
ncbi:MAG TPA: hypothetical protein VEK57_04580 [Thermoanaerobaculia bacterium]|nr:hypothetical protein [Thermoanaerobaculia bacterium]